MTIGISDSSSDDIWEGATTDGKEDLLDLAVILFFYLWSDLRYSLLSFGSIGDAKELFASISWVY